MIVSGLFGAGQRLHHGNRDAEADRSGKRNQLARIDFAGRGTNDHDDADDAEHDRGELPERDAFAEKHRGQDRGPDRHGEFDRHHLADRDQRQRKEPAELRAEMDGVARDVLRQALRLHDGQNRRRARSAEYSRQESDARADQHQLEHVELAHRLAAGDRDRSASGRASRPSTARPSVWRECDPSKMEFENGQAGMFDLACLCNGQICRGSTARGSISLWDHGPDRC